MIETKSLRTTELIRGLGAKVEVDLHDALTPEQRSELRQLFNTHHLLFIEAGELSVEAQIDFAKTFGKIVPTSAVDEKEATFVSNSRPDGYLGNMELAWHTDACFIVEPFRAAVLLALDVPAGASSTRFISAAQAVRRLPRDLYNKFRFLQLINTSETSTKIGSRVDSFGCDLVAAAHPIIATHPVTGVEYLTVNPFHTDCILGMDVEESRAALQEIYSYFYDEDAIYEHPWENGNLVIWDNLAVQHSRRDISNVGTRTLRRVSVGMATFAEQIPDRQYRDYLQNLRSRQQAAAASAMGKSALSGATDRE